MSSLANRRSATMGCGLWRGLMAMPGSRCPLQTRPHPSPLRRPRRPNLSATAVAVAQGSAACLALPAIARAACRSSQPATRPAGLLASAGLRARPAIAFKPTGSTGLLRRQESTRPRQESPRNHKAEKATLTTGVAFRKTVRRPDSASGVGTGTRLRTPDRNRSRNRIQVAFESHVNLQVYSSRCEAMCRGARSR